MKLTKIVATIGPATETEEILQELISAGMNVARFNTKHSDPDWHQIRVERVDQIRKKLQVPIGILLDLQGPEIRVDLPGKKEFELKKNEEVFIASEAQSQGHTIIVPEAVIQALSIGSHIIMADGACELDVTAKTPSVIKAQALFDCVVKDRKTMNTPGAVPNMPSLTERDLAYLDRVDLSKVDFVGLSFVRNKHDIKILREQLLKRHSQARVVAKIENEAALDNLDEIIDESDAIMVARGDLGVEVPFEQLIYWQKKLIDKCRLAAKPVITATEMLKSMIDHPRPTRAEVSDVAHAIYDGTDAIMLSEETTIGEYPIKAVMTQAKIAEFNEPYTDLTRDFAVDQQASSLANSAMTVLKQTKVDKIICASSTGQTARLLSRCRPHLKINVLTSQPSTYQQLSLSYGVKSFLTENRPAQITPTDWMREQSLKLKIAEVGEKVLLIHGKIFEPGSTDTLSVITI